MTGPFVTATDLARELESSAPPAVLDASLVLHSPKFDGDYRRDSGLPSWLDHHIPGSQHVDVAAVFSDTDAPLHYTHQQPQQIADALAGLGIGADRRVVVYDSTGTLWAARLWYLLRWIGHDVRVLDGGLAAWDAEGLPTESGESVAPSPVATWPAREARPAWVTKEELVDRSGEAPLVCGLPAGSFDGSAPTRYSRRGRIPGSVNVSSRDLFSSDATVKGTGEIVDAYASAGIDGTEPEVLLYCGGGISASANALTLVAIGIDAVRIYDGSLEEWSADPALPLDVG